MDNVVPILTGERRRSGGYVSVEAYNVVLDQHAETWRELREAVQLIEAAEVEVQRLHDELRDARTSERRRGPSRYGLYAACMAGGVFVGWLLGGLGL